MSQNGKNQRKGGQGLVQATAEAMREAILSAEPETRIGSLSTIAESMGVGIVTVQQAARILEHEGLLDVRRGPGGGYYGKRPDKASLERLIEAYIRHQPIGYAEALDIVTLLFCELVAAAADCRDTALMQELTTLVSELDQCRTQEESGVFEEKFQTILFRMVDRPLFELLTTVALHLYSSWPRPPFYEGETGIGVWRAGRQRLLNAIISGDSELAHFEANRHRKLLLARFEELGENGLSPANDG